MQVEIFDYAFEADLSFEAGDPGNLNGLPENCWPSTPDSAEFIDYGPFDNMFEAVYAACWICDQSMSEEEMHRLSEKVEAETIRRFLNEDNNYL